MRIDVVSIFPEYLAPLDVSLLGKARERGLLEVHVHDLRTWTDDVHRTIDDAPYGGGPGMVMKPEPWLLFACGRYEGIDARVLEHASTRMPVDEVSLGDYVLAGGEVAVLVIVEAVGRLLPGVLGNAESHRDDSFAAGAMEALIEGPVYTRPPVWAGLEVPAVLQSGDHARIARWQRESALRRTAQRRPDLLARIWAELSPAERTTLRDEGFDPPPEAVAP